MQSENGFPESTQCSVITNGLGNSLSMQHQAFNHDFNNHNDLGSIMEQNVGATIHHMSGLGQFKGETPQTVPVMSHTPPSVSPIDLINQEMMKSERKRQRNRVAASKCRKRKLERISQLEERVKNLKQQNIELSKNGSILRQQVAELKSKVMAHVTSGCQLMMNQQQLQMGEAIST